MRALGLVELKGPGQRFEHELGDAADLAALQAPVVVGAHAGQRRDLLATQAGHAPRAEARQARLLGRDLRPAAGEELGDVAGGIHGRAVAPGLAGAAKSTVDLPHGLLRGLAGTPLTGPLRRRGTRGGHSEAHEHRLTNTGRVARHHRRVVGHRRGHRPSAGRRRLPRRAAGPPRRPHPGARRRARRRRDRHRGRRHRPRLARRRRPARPGRARRRRRPGQQRRRDAARPVHLRAARRAAARWSRSTCSAR